MGFSIHSTSGIVLLQFPEPGSERPDEARILAVNPAFHDVMGRYAREMVGKVFTEFLPDERHRGIHKILARIAFEGGTYSEEFYNGAVKKHVYVTFFSDPPGTGSGYLR